MINSGIPSVADPKMADSEGNPESNDSIFFKLLCSLRLLISRDVGIFV